MPDLVPLPRGRTVTPDDLVVHFRSRALIAEAVASPALDYIDQDRVRDQNLIDTFNRCVRFNRALDAAH